MAALREAFEDSDLPFKVDLVDLHGVEARFREAIRREAVTVQQGAEARAPTPPTCGSLGMASEWHEATLGDLIAIQRGHDLTETERRPGIVPVFGSAGQNGCHDKALAPAPGVVIGRSGASFGQINYCDVPYWPHNTTLYVTDFKGNDPLFVYYCLKGMDFSRYNSGSAQQSLNRNYIYSAPLLIPDPGSQRAIAHILGTLDDRIEANRRMAATLEEMARALFRAWFVTFEPVRAKAERRWRPGQSLPGLPAGLYDAFTDRVVETEHGEIPEGWHFSTIGAEARVVGGSTPRTENPEFWDGDIHWATPKDLSGLAGPVLLDTARKITKEGLTTISSGLLPAGTVLLSSRAPIGYIAISAVPVAVNQGFIALVCEGALSNAFVWLWIGENIPAILSRANGSTFQEVSKANFRPIPVVVPNELVVRPFNRQAQPILARIMTCERERVALTTLRDTLLPKLVSGAIRVKDAEAFLKTRGL
jgi:type I restriction enzyme S subunit